MCMCPDLLQPFPRYSAVFRGRRLKRVSVQVLRLNRFFPSQSLSLSLSLSRFLMKLSKRQNEIQKDQKRIKERGHDDGGGEVRDGDKELEAVHVEPKHHTREREAEEESSSSSSRKPSLAISASKQAQTFSPGEESLIPYRSSSASPGARLIS